MRHAFLLDLALERLSHLLDVALLVDLNGQVQVVPRTELKFSSKKIKILKNGGHGNLTREMRLVKPAGRKGFWTQFSTGRE